jgi:hypothetical protein
LNAAHAQVEHIDCENIEAVVTADEKIKMMQVVRPSETLPAALEEHAASAVKPHIHVPCAGTPNANLTHLQITGFTALQQVRKLLRQRLHQRIEQTMNIITPNLTNMTPKLSTIPIFQMKHPLL